MGLELIKLARLATQLAPGMRLSPSLYPGITSVSHTPSSSCECWALSIVLVYACIVPRLCRESAMEGELLVPPPATTGGQRRFKDFPFEHGLAKTREGNYPMLPPWLLCGFNWGDFARSL